MYRLVARTTNHELSQAGFEELIVDSDPMRMFNRRKRILHHELDIDVDIYLLQW